MRCDELGLGATVKLTEPVPEPVAPAVTVIQVTPLTAVQEQPVVVVTVVDSSAPAAATDRLDGEIEYEHPAGSCVTLNACPAIVNVPLRCDAPVLAAALKATVPFPLPLAPLVTVSQPVSLLIAVQVQPPGAVTSVKAGPPATGIA